MPELPEVEEVRRTLEPIVIGIAVQNIRLLRKDYIRTPSAPLSRLLGRKIVATFRQGKKLFCRFDDNQTLLFHLGMSGRLESFLREDPVHLHSHFIMELESGIEIRMRDPRRFGGIWYYPTFDSALSHQVIGKLGVDALELTPKHLTHWCNVRGRLKSRLLAQRDVAGLGNIYVDEALWLSSLHPLAQVDRLSKAQICRLVNAIQGVLRKSIASGGTTLRDYRNVAGQLGSFARHLNVYGRRDQPCRRCKSLLKSRIVAGRSTVFCPHCQKSP